ncbi:outer membrane protein [Sphingomonas sp. NFR15]|uniref:outer membrane protein n=1 Tax=Sphingomonas sp. NFR15 TaxID=1566282 RepID=UPI000890534D|nr:opacity protein [Sphingomonas sp. NFR15]SDA35562.1 Opacity protein [Sphingomonas sp. NFR15]
MLKLKLAAAALAVFAAAPAVAQDTAAPAGTETAPDGTKAFGIEPYVGVMGGWEQFDNEPNHGIPRALNANGSLRNNYRLAGALVQGVAGVNVPLGPVFVGVEGSVAKGVSGNIDWEYGAAGRFGVRAGDSGMFYGKVGYQWVDFDHYSTYSTGNRNKKNYNDMTYGIGTEFGPKDIGLKGITGNAGFRIRAEVNTYGDFHSFRPMMGVITHF